MARCGCGGTCSCLIEGGPGIQVDGIGTVENPYTISSGVNDILGRLDFIDSSTIDFTVTGEGTLQQPMTVTANAQVSMEELTDVQGAPTNGQVMVWVDDHWEPQNQSGGGGGTGLPPGGVAGDRLVKQSSADGDATWETPPDTTLDYVILRTAATQTMASGTETNMVYQGAASLDPKGMWDGSSLVTVQKDGVYRVTCFYSFAGTSNAGSRIALVRINGSTQRQWYIPVPPSGTTPLHGVVTQDFNLVAGDTVQFRQYQSSGANLDTGSITLAYGVGLSVVRQGSAQASTQPIVMGERVYASSRRQAAAVAVANATSVVIPFDTEDFTDGIPWESANSGFRIPVAGYYQVTAKMDWNNTNAASYRQTRILVNGSVTVAGVVNVTPNASTTFGVSSTASRTLKLSAGDLVQAGGYQTSGVSLNAAAGGVGNNSFDIVKVPAPVVPGRAASGVWPLYGITDPGLQDKGLPIYADSQGQLRAGPIVIGDSAQFSASTAVDAYPYGMSVLTVFNGSTGGWPTGPTGQTSATVFTARRSDNAAMQWWSSNLQSAGNAQVMVRTGSAGVWSTWMPVARDSGWQPLINLASGWTVPAGYPAPQARILGTEVVFKGRLVNASFTGGYTDMIQLPASIPNPPYTCAFPMGTNTAAYKACQILTGNGMVQAYSSVASGSHIDFASVRYPID